MSILKPEAVENTDKIWRVVWVGLGGNVGDVKSTMAGALQSLSRHDCIYVDQVSDLYKTPPWGDENQDWFFNCCAELQTCMEPIELLAAVKQEEKNAARKKTRRWGPRTLDIDLLIFDEVKLDSEGLTLPHPRMQDRGFVLLPLLQIAPQLKLLGQSIQVHLDKLDCSDIEPQNMSRHWWREEV